MLRSILRVRIELCFKLHWGQVTKSGVDALVHLHIPQELLYLLIRLSIVLIIRQVHPLLFDGAHQSLCVAVLPRRTHFGLTDLDCVRPQQVHIGRRHVLHTLIRIMNLRLVLLQCPLQNRQCEFLHQCASQMPITNIAGEDIHQHGQVYKFISQEHVGDVHHPHLSRARYSQLRYQVRVTRERMFAVGRATPLPWMFTLQFQFRHQPMSLFSIHRLLIVPAQLHHKAAITIRWLAPDQHLEARLKGAFIFLGMRCVVIGAARQFQRRTQQCGWILIRQLLHQHAFGFHAHPGLAVAFFRISNSDVWRPTKRSNFAVRCCSWLRDSSRTKTCAAWLIKSVFQPETTWGLS